jgi:hypothetical protein
VAGRSDVALMMGTFHAPEKTELSVKVGCGLMAVSLFREFSNPINLFWAANFNDNLVS